MAVGVVLFAIFAWLNSLPFAQWPFFIGGAAVTIGMKKLLTPQRGHGVATVLLLSVLLAATAALIALAAAGTAAFVLIFCAAYVACVYLAESLSSGCKVIRNCRYERALGSALIGIGLMLTIMITGRVSIGPDGPGEIDAYMSGYWLWLSSGFILAAASRAPLRHDDNADTLREHARHDE